GRILALGGTDVVLFDLLGDQQLKRVVPDPPSWTISDCAFSPDGERLVVAGSRMRGSLGKEGMFLKTYNLQSGELLRRTPVSDVPGELRVVYSPDGRFIATSQGGPEVEFWDTGSGDSLFKLSWKDARPDGLAISPSDNLLVTYSHNGYVLLWDLRRFEQFKKLAPPKRPEAPNK